MVNLLPIPFNKGLNPSVDFLSSQPGDCLTMTDYQLQYGIARPRTSAQKVNTATLPDSTNPMAVAYWIGANLNFGTNGHLYAISFGGNIYYSDTYYHPNVLVGSAWDSITNSVTQPNSPITFASLNGYLVYAGKGSGNAGIVNYILTDTGNSTNLSAAPQGLMVYSANNFMFTACTSSARSRVYWSNVGDPTTWPGANFIDFRISDGDYVTALGQVNGNLLIFKNNSIGLLNTQSVSISGTVTLGPLTTLFTGVGVPLPTCVDNIGDGRCVFWANSGDIYLTDGVTLENITNQPPPGVNFHSLFSGQSPQYYNGQTGLVYDPSTNFIYLNFITTGGGAFQIYCYDLNQNYWRLVTPPASIIFSLNSARNTNIFADTYPSSTVLACASDGYIYDINFGNTGIPTSGSGSVLNPSLSMSVVIPPNIFSSDECFLSILYKAPSGSIYFQYGFDNGGYGSAIALPTTSNRLDYKLSLKSNSTTGQRPSSFQINFLGANGGNYDGGYIYQIYLSDESTA